MEEQVIQQAKEISRKIVEEEFPEEEEYFDFLFDLTIQEIEELEPGKEAEFLREMRAIHPELVLGFTPIVIILTVQVLAEIPPKKIKPDGESIKNLIDERIRAILKDNSSRGRFSGIDKYFKDI